MIPINGQIDQGHGTVYIGDLRAKLIGVDMPSRWRLPKRFTAFTPLLRGSEYGLSPNF